MKDFDGPSFDQDVEVAKGVPAGPRELQRRLEASDAFVISSPEYNGSMPGLLKNAIDWVSRIRPRIPLEPLGARVFPDMFSLSQAHNAFDPNGQLVDQLLRARFEQNLVAFLDLVEAAKHYPCLKKAWVEFLGEPGATVGREGRARALVCRRRGGFFTRDRPPEQRTALSLGRARSRSTPPKKRSDRRVLSPRS
jgi:NAD(P)H-dependent FMN reductase